MKHNNLENMSRKVVEETTELHHRYKREKEEGVKIRSDANKVRLNKNKPLFWTMYNYLVYR